MNPKQVRQFLGAANYYRRFVKNFSEIAKPLTELTKKETQFVWTENCQISFDKLKHALTSPEIMAFPKLDAEFILDTDASLESIGAVLSQVQDGVERVIAYGSRTLNKAERNYCVTDRELLAIRYFVEYFRHYLIGKPFRLRTDHQALKWLFNLKEPKGRIARWIETLSTYVFEIEFRPGKKHLNADAMSRCPNPNQCNCDLNDLKCGPCKKCHKRHFEMKGTVEEDALIINRVDQMSNKSQQLFIKLFMTLYSIFTIITSLPYSAIRKISDCLNIFGLDKYWEISENFLRNNFNMKHESIMPIAKSIQDDGRLKPKLLSKLSRGSRIINQVRKVISETLNLAKLKAYQISDPELTNVIEWLKAGIRPPGAEIVGCSPAVRHYWNYFNSLEYVDGLLYKKFHKVDGTDSYLQLIIPRQLRDLVLRQMHDCILSGHLGRKKTLKRIQQKFYWYDLESDVNVWVAKCTICASTKRPTKNPRAPLGLMITGAPWDRISLDFCGPFPVTERGNKYTLTIIDAQSKWVEIFAVPDETADTAAQILLNEIISRYGCPLEILTDQGRAFESKIFKELSKFLEIRKVRTTPRNPKCNGQVERFHKTLLAMIRAYIKDQKDWDLNLGCLAGAYRSTPNETTSLSPNMMILGREVRSPLEITLYPNSNNKNWPTAGDYVSSLREKLFKAHSVARKHLEIASNRQKARYDAKSASQKFQVNDLIWLLNEKREEGTCQKLQPLYEGPLLITNKFNDWLYEIQLNKNGKRKVIHHDKLKPYLGTDVPKWINAHIKLSDTQPMHKL
jgi:transposase InsO family protein